MENFAALKRNRTSELEKLTKKLKELNQNTFQDDERFWQPTVDSAGNGSAIIRFLPAPIGEEIPFVRVWKHTFEGENGWFIENCPTTLSKECPVCQMNSKLWKAGKENSPERKQVSRQKRNLAFISNIYIVKDPAKPENDGKVFLFRYGKKIFDKLNSKMNPDEDLDEKAINPFDLWEGANFRLKIRKVDGQRNYDTSEFVSPAPLLKDDDALEKIWNSEFALSEFNDPKVFKSYKELSERLNKVLKQAGSASVAEEDEDVNEHPNSVVEEKTVNVQSTDDETVSNEEDDENLEFFKNLAQEDDD